MVRLALPQAAFAVAGGLALAIAFPRFDWDGAAWVALVPLLTIAVLVRPRAAFGWGWLTGFVFFAVLLGWLNFTFRVYTSFPWPLFYVPTLLLAAYCGLYFGLVSGAVSWIAARRSAASALLAAPFLWVVAEWVRGHFLGGFPWGSVGYAQYVRLTVIQIAELAGVYGVSFVLVAVNAAVAGALTLPWRRAVTGLVLGAVVLGATLAFGAFRLREPEAPATAPIAVMQPSIEQPLKFSPDFASTTLGIYFALTRQAIAEHPRLVVWPETATPTLLRRDPALVRALTDLSASTGVALLVGSVDAEPGSGGRPEYRNSAFLITGEGIGGRYDKIHLVPFGEFVPLSRVIGFVRGWAEFIAELTPGSRPLVFPGPPAPFGVVICYEGIFPDLVREFVRGGARLMVNMTNDAWFGRTSGPQQHLAMYPFRAVEHRVSVVRAANTGVSAFIAPTGRIARWMSLFERGVMTQPVPLRNVTTIYTRFGDWFVWLSAAVSAAVLGATFGRKRA